MRQFFYLTILFIAFFNSQSLLAQSCVLNPPGNLSLKNITSCSVKFKWHSSASVASYRVSYKLASSNQWAPFINVGNDSSHIFNNLLPGKKYNFSVFSKCTDGSKSPKSKTSGTTKICTLPSQVTINQLSAQSVSLSLVTSCPYDSAHIRYSTLTGAFTYKSFLPAGSFVISGLAADTTYLFQVSTCPLAENEWTLSDTVKPAQKPNIILILLDDSRFDYFSCNGAPSFFQTPSIDRIANEGVNFKNSYCVTSLCAPSRATIATGLFSLKTGVTENGINLDTSIVTVPKVLKVNGYYTALVGKNHGTFLHSAQPEFNYYLWSLGIEANAGIKFNYNGTNITINKNNSLTLTDTAIAVIKRVNEPLFLWLAYQAPHFPLSPIPSFSGRYDSYTIPWLPDTAKYTENLPSALYNLDNETLHGIGMDTLYRQSLEVTGQLDSCVGEIIKALESTGKLDNTLLIFTNDNGYMLGNHWIRGKTYPYEASTRVPLFIRYPKWFADSSIITNQLVSNEDIAPTMYEAAQVPNPIGMDGSSLKKIYDGTVKQKEFYYLMLRDSSGVNPTARSIQDKHFKYIHYSCTDSVEEFFDMANDPLELKNLINNSVYSSTIQKYRLMYDSMKLAMGDNGIDVVRPCFLENPVFLKEILEDNELPDHAVVYPTLMTAGTAEIYIPWKSADAKLFDENGHLLMGWKIMSQFSKSDFPELSNGMYFMQLRHGGSLETVKLVVANK